MRLSWRLTLAAASVLAACDAPGPTEIASPRPLSPTLHASGGDDDRERSTVDGEGIYRLQAAFDVRFEVEARLNRRGRARGEFRHRLVANGLVIDFSGKLTCLAVDEANNRAWIGGVVTRNRSTDPAFKTAIHQRGKDVWFRVVDYGRGSSLTPDRTSFIGFEGAAGIRTSAEYCAARLWPANDERTWPVTKGGIRVR